MIYADKDTDCGCTKCPCHERTQEGEFARVKIVHDGRVKLKEEQSARDLKKNAEVERRRDISLASTRGLSAVTRGGWRTTSRCAAGKREDDEDYAPQCDCEQPN